MPLSPARPVPARIFTQAERQAFYDIVAARRDVRNEFEDRPVAEDVLKRGPPQPLFLVNRDCPSTG